ncbi:MAG: hypothetical protein V3T37_01160 [Syntrophobacteria bacterium]
MKIWCIFKSDTAIKWRELLVVDEPPPLACVAYNIFVKTPEHPGESNGRQRVLDSILAMLLSLIVAPEWDTPEKIDLLEGLYPNVANLNRPKPLNSRQSTPSAPLLASARISRTVNVRFDLPETARGHI